MADSLTHAPDISSAGIQSVATDIVHGAPNLVPGSLLVIGGLGLLIYGRRSGWMRIVALSALGIYALRTVNPYPTT